MVFVPNTQQLITNIMEITINTIELASELAHERVRDYISFEHNIFVEEDEGTVYTGEAQDIFNEWYDYYLTKIESTKI